MDEQNGQGFCPDLRFLSQRITIKGFSVIVKINIILIAQELEETCMIKTKKQSFLCEIKVTHLSFLLPFYWGCQIWHLRI